MTVNKARPSETSTKSQGILLHSLGLGLALDCDVRSRPCPLPSLQAWEVHAIGPAARLSLEKPGKELGEALVRTLRDRSVMGSVPALALQSPLGESTTPTPGHCSRGRGTC